MNGMTRVALAAAGAGVMAMYFFDPVLGRRRRSGIRDRGEWLWHNSETFADKAARDFANRAHGMEAKAKALFRRQPVAESVLIARVRSHLGRLSSHPRALDVSVANGVVTLTGPVLTHERKRIVGGLGRVHGVRSIIDHMDAHENADIPALQGGRDRAARWEFMQSRWTPALRCAAALSGGTMVGFGVRQRGLAGALIGVTGSALLLRSVMNRDLETIVGLGDDRRSIEVHKTITIHAPIDQVYKFWSHVENFPRFMKHVSEVKDLGDGRSRWKVTPLAGMPFEWKAEITSRTENSDLIWTSAPESVVRHSGSVHFHANDDHSTQVDVRISYRPPAGAIGHTLASMLGADPKRLLMDELARIKSLLEEGRARVHGKHVAIGDLQMGSA